MLLPSPNLFDFQFLSLTIDEVHAVRNQTKLFVPLVQQSLCSLFLSATPLFTGTDDLFNLGALGQIPKLACWEGLEMYKEIQKDLRASKRLITKVDLEEEHKIFMAAPLPQAAPRAETSSTSASTSTTGDLPLSSVATLRPDSILGYEQVARGVLRQLRGYFEGYLIRRGPHSKDWEGKPLLSLPAVNMQYIFLEISGAEEDSLHEIQAEEDKYVTLL